MERQRDAQGRPDWGRRSKANYAGLGGPLQLFICSPTARERALTEKEAPSVLSGYFAKSRAAGELRQHRVSKHGASRTSTATMLRKRASEKEERLRESGPGPRGAGNGPR